MKVAAAHSLTALAKQDVPDSVLCAYNLDRLRFGPNYIIPKPFNPRMLLWEAPTVAKAAMESGAARISIDLDEYPSQLALRQGKDKQVRQFIIHKATQNPKRVVFGEGEEPKIIRAAAQIVESKIGIPILLGRPDAIQA